MVLTIRAQEAFRRTSSSLNIDNTPPRITKVAGIFDSRLFVLHVLGHLTQLDLPSQYFKCLAMSPFCTMYFGDCLLCHGWNLGLDASQEIPSRPTIFIGSGVYRRHLLNQSHDRIIFRFHIGVLDPKVVGMS